MAVDTIATASVRPEEHVRACTEAYEDHGPFVWRSLRHLGVPASDLEDALQDVFLVVHRKLHTWDRQCSMKTWLFGLARMVAMSRRKRAHVRRERAVATVPEVVDHRAPDRAAQNAQAFARALAIVETMEPDLRIVFTLYEIEEMPMKEVASALAVPIQTAYSRLHRARHVFARSVQGGGEHE